MSRLARVRSFWRLCHSAAAPRSKGRACAAASGSEPVAVGDWARTDEDRMNKGHVQSKARKTDATRLLKRNRILPPRLGSREATAAELRTASDKNLQAVRKQAQRTYTRRLVNRNHRTRG